MPDLSGISSFLKGFMAGDAQRKQEILDEMRTLTGNIATMSNVQQMQQQMKLSQAQEERTKQLFPAQLRSEEAQTQMVERKNIQQQKTIEAYQKLISDLGLPTETTPEAMANYVATAEGQQRMLQLKIEQGLEMPKQRAMSEKAALGAATATAERTEASARAELGQELPGLEAEANKQKLKMAISLNNALIASNYPDAQAKSMIETLLLDVPLKQAEINYRNAMAATAGIRASANDALEANRWLDAEFKRLKNIQEKETKEYAKEMWGTTPESVADSLNVISSLNSQRSARLTELKNLQNEHNNEKNNRIASGDPDILARYNTRDKEMAEEEKTIKDVIDQIDTLIARQQSAIKIGPQGNMTKDKLLQYKGKMPLSNALINSDIIDSIVYSINNKTELKKIGELLYSFKTDTDKSYGKGATWFLMRLLEAYAKDINDKGLDSISMRRYDLYQSDDIPAYMKSKEEKKLKPLGIEKPQAQAVPQTQTQTKPVSKKAPNELPIEEYNKFATQWKSAREEGKESETMPQYSENKYLLNAIYKSSHEPSAIMPYYEPTINDIYQYLKKKDVKYDPKNPKVFDSILNSIQNTLGIAFTQQDKINIKNWIRQGNE